MAGRSNIFKLAIIFCTLLNIISHVFNQFCSSRTGNFFEKVKGSSRASSTNRHFHKCSIDQTCVYIAKKTETADYETLSVVPNMVDYQEVWKKVEHPDYIDCKEAQAHGITSGVVRLRLNSLAIQAYCDMCTSGGGWTVFQRRVDGSVDFNRNWQSYQEGFGDLKGNFWLGLEALHQLTSNGKATLRVDLTKADLTKGYVEFGGFRILDESAKYVMQWDSQMTGDARHNALEGNKGMMFSTYDSDNDRSSTNCAETRKGGWWYKSCSKANLNSEYYNKSEVGGEEGKKHMTWKSYWSDSKYGNIIFSEMKLRRDD